MSVDDRVLPLSRRLEQEIESLGMQVVFVPADSSEASSSAVAVIRLSPLGGDDIDMSIVDGAGKTVRYQLISSNPGDSQASELIATRAVELLRASLLELASAPPRRAPGVVAPTPSTEARVDGQATTARSTLSLSLGPAALYAARFGPGASLQGSLTWLPFPVLGLGLSAVVPIATPRLEATQGSVTLAANLFRLGGVVALGGGERPVSLRASAGIELDDLRFRGLAAEPYRSSDEHRVSWSGFVGVAPRFRVASNLHVVAELVVALASSSSRVRLAGEEVARFGRPFGTASLALELTLPTGTR